MGCVRFCLVYVMFWVLCNGAASSVCFFSKRAEHMVIKPIFLEGNRDSEWKKKTDALSLKKISENSESGFVQSIAIRTQYTVIKSILKTDDLSCPCDSNQRHISLRSPYNSFKFVVEVERSQEFFFPLEAVWIQNPTISKRPLTAGWFEHGGVLVCVAVPNISPSRAVCTQFLW